LLCTCSQAASLTLDKLEESYWHEFNDFQLQLRAHVDERDTILSKVGARSQPLCRLWLSASVIADWRPCTCMRKHTGLH
jgi:hypothetical protein